MVTYKSITLNLDKKMISEIENLMNSKTQTETGITIFEVHHGNKQDFYRRLLREGFNVVNLDYEQKVKEMRLKYANKDSDSPKNTKETKSR